VTSGTIHETQSFAEGEFVASRSRVPARSSGRAPFILGTGPLPQLLSYHQFADSRLLLGIPHGGDVLTNLAFIIVGARGPWFLPQPNQKTRTFLDERERVLFQWFFAGVLLTGFVSGWYHLAPDNDSLLWDQIPMAIGFMSVVAIMLAERVKTSLGFTLLVPLVVIAVATVFCRI
jgi:hypothetical protein